MRLKNIVVQACAMVGGALMFSSCTDYLDLSLIHISEPTRLL